MKIKKLGLFITMSVFVLGSVSLAGDEIKPEHKIHVGHKHKHSANCGHEVVQHNDHVDYKDGTHFHKKHGNHWDECTGPQTAQN